MGRFGDRSARRILYSDNRPQKTRNVNSARGAKIGPFQRHGRVCVETRRSFFRFAHFKTNRFSPITLRKPKINLESRRVFFRSSSPARDRRAGTPSDFSRGAKINAKYHSWSHGVSSPSCLINLTKVSRMAQFSKGLSL